MDSLPLLCAVVGSGRDRSLHGSWPSPRFIGGHNSVSHTCRQTLTHRETQQLLRTCISLENRCLRIWVNHHFSYYNKPNRRIMKYWLVSCAWNIFISLHRAEILEVHYFSYFMHLSNNIYALPISIDAFRGRQIFSVKNALLFLTSIKRTLKGSGL